MKKSLFFLLILSTIIMLQGCQMPSAKPSETPLVSASPEPSAPVNSTGGVETSATKSAVQLFLAEDPSAVEIGAYLQERSPTTTTEDGDLLLERLLLLQLDISLAMNERIWEEAYMTALNDTLGGVLDADKIGSITEPDVRSTFQELSDALMTLVRYEETPVFEPNWAALFAIKDTFSTYAAAMIDYQSRLQGRYYYGQAQLFDMMAEDIVAVEKSIAENDGGFVRWQLRAAYSKLVGRILYGPEGSYLEQFTSGDAEIVNNLKKYTGLYPNSKFGAICGKMLELQNEDMMVISGYISDEMILPPGDSRTIKTTVTHKSGVTFTLPVMSSGYESEVMDKINDTVENAAVSMLETGTTDQNIGCYMSLCGKYLCVTLFYSYSDNANLYGYKELNLILDSSTGETKTLDDLVGKDFDLYKDQLLLVMHGDKLPAELNAPVLFALNNTELTVSIPTQGSTWPDYFVVTYNGLRSFMDISQLY